MAPETDELRRIRCELDRMAHSRLLAPFTRDEHIRFARLAQRELELLRHDDVGEDACRSVSVVSR